MNRTFKVSFVLGFLLFSALTAFTTNAADQPWREGDLLRLDCLSEQNRIPGYLSVHEISGQSLIRLGAVEDRILRGLLVNLEAQHGRKYVDEFRGVVLNRDSGQQETIREGASADVRKISGGGMEIQHGHVIPSSGAGGAEYRSTFVLRCSNGKSECTAVQGVEGATREEFSCKVKRISPCAWFTRLKEEQVRKRAEILKNVGEDNWKIAFDAEQIEKASTFLMEKYSCPVAALNVNL